MFRKVKFKTNETVGDTSLITYSYSQDVDAYRRLEIIFAEDEHDCIVFKDSELPKGNTYEVRGDGIWADVNCEVPNEHWSFSLESFALRLPIEEFLGYKDSQDGLLIGERVAFGYELDLVSVNGQDWLLSGDVLIEKSVVEIKNLETTLSLK